MCLLAALKSTSAVGMFNAKVVMFASSLTEYSFYSVDTTKWHDLHYLDL
jgi:hypothetical protein